MSASTQLGRRSGDVESPRDQCLTELIVYLSSHLLSESFGRGVLAGHFEEVASCK